MHFGHFTLNNEYSRQEYQNSQYTKVQTSTKLNDANYLIFYSWFDVRMLKVSYIQLFSQHSDFDVHKVCILCSSLKSLDFKDIL